MNKTTIGWTDFTSNPIRYHAAGRQVHACERISPGCAHCYAATLAKRYGRGGGEFTKAERETYTPYFDEAEARKILTAKTVGGKPVSGSRCFIGDMTDVFGEWVPDELLDKLFAVMALRSDVAFQVLTKRPERARAYMASVEREACWMNATAWALEAFGELLDTRPAILGRKEPWLPLPNVWLGTSVENQHWADKRIPELLQTPAAVRFLSIEPLLGPVDLDRFTCGDCGYSHARVASMKAMKSKCPHCEHCDEHAGPENVYWLGRSPSPRSETPGIDWGILGGESGANLRDPGLPAFEHVARQFQQAGVPLFVKQDVHRRPGQQGRFPADLWAMKQFPAVGQ